MSDIYDKIAAKVWDGEIPGLSTTPQAFAAAFRAHFAQRTCATCREWRKPEPNVFGYCKYGLTTEASWPNGLNAETFSCSLWEPKP